MIVSLFVPAYSIFCLMRGAYRLTVPVSSTKLEQQTLDQFSFKDTPVSFKEEKTICRVLRNEKLQKPEPTSLRTHRHPRLGRSSSPRHPPGAHGTRYLTVSYSLVSIRISKILQTCLDLKSRPNRHLVNTFRWTRTVESCGNVCGSARGARPVKSDLA